MVAAAALEEHFQFVTWTICACNLSLHATKFPLACSQAPVLSQPLFLVSLGSGQQPDDSEYKRCIAPPALLHLAYCWLSLEEI
jgi:hypothetical protein